MITLAEWNTWTRQKQTAYKTQLRERRAALHQKMRDISGEANSVSAELYCISTWSPPVPIPMAEDFLSKVRKVAPKSTGKRTTGIQLKLVQVQAVQAE